MLIRDVQAEDFEAIAEITNHYILHTTIHFGYDPVSAAELRDGWIKYGSRFPYLVGVDEGSKGAAVIGFAKSGTWRDRAAYERTAEVGIYLLPDSQGRGLGTRLYRALIEACREKGFHTLVGGIALPNPASERLHAACGFERVGMYKQVGWKFEAWHDTVFYQLML